MGFIKSGPVGAWRTGVWSPLRTLRPRIRRTALVRQDGPPAAAAAVTAAVT
ncbi:hypothetical protein SAMN05421773_101578 [Streptomyces aidingensis]|uniref:Uncharacterized protein n=1 Tax=Streptomyces aidingensis TaxID=910347 RepID=A0A1I1F2T2_9ACTN|nr:hypothetical protein SAMN05421773_101578 [Streptomyces aidingensis]